LSIYICIINVVFGVLSVSQRNGVAVNTDVSL